jgi:hypothetical protein
MRIAFIGDTHGDLDALARQAAAASAGAGVAVQRGDLGFRAELLGPGRRWPRLPLPVLAVCGNHEDHAFLAAARRDGLAAAWAAHGLCYQPRGSLATVAGTVIGFLGGALHADRPQDADGGSRIAAAEVDAALAAFALRPPDLIATHACPAGIGIGMRGAPALAHLVARHVVAAGIDPGPADDIGETALRRLWDGLPRRPRLWAFGHFHVAHAVRVGGTRFLGLPEATAMAAPVLWDPTGDAISGADMA